MINILSSLVGLRVGYKFGAIRGMDDMGYIGCKDGKLTIKNIFVDSLKSEAFHFGNDPCNGYGASITIDGTPEKKP